MRTSSLPWILPVLIVLLALADGVLHLSLDFVLFRGNLFGTLGPPPGAPGPPPGSGGPRFLLPLNQAFVGNCVGYVVLAIAFWFATHPPRSWSWLLDALLILYTAVVFFAWWNFGRPNPMNLGYLSKTIEVILVIALLVHAWMWFGAQRAVREPALRST